MEAAHSRPSICVWNVQYSLTSLPLPLPISPTTLIMPLCWRACCRHWKRHQLIDTTPPLPLTRRSANLNPSLPHLYARFLTQHHQQQRKQFMLHCVPLPRFTRQMTDLQGRKMLVSMPPLTFVKSVLNLSPFSSSLFSLILYINTTL